MKSPNDIPRWVRDRYDILWKHFEDRPFRLDDAARVLKEDKKDEKMLIPVIFSELRNAGWLKEELDKEDSRRRIYTLIGRGQMLKEVFTIKGESIGRGELESILKRGADLIRTRVDYKFILVLLFLKRISDKWELEYQTAYKEALSEGLNENEAKQEAKSAAYHDFDMPEWCLWDNIRKDVSLLPERFSKAMKDIADRNPELRDILDQMDFVQFASNRENTEILRQLVELFSEKKLHHVSSDILGDAYEWILRYFAPTKAKEGEVYTPREVITLLVKILDPKPQESVYDPASGSNGMLIISHQHIREKYGDEQTEKLFLYGQEVNPKTVALGRMNIYIHDIKNAQLALGDTLLYPKFKEGNGIKKFDVVVANPPWNQDGYPEEVVKKGDSWETRFPYGFSGNQSADWLWVQHMLSSAKEDTGRVGVVIDNGCLFRGGKERAIRVKAIEEDKIECVILLPEKLFYNTGAPGAIMILRHNKPPERKEKILFINASSEFEKHPEVRKLNILAPGNVERIVQAYQEFKEIKGFCRPVSLEEIKKNNYNLNVTLYVFPEEEVEEIDVNKEWEELRKVDEQIVDVEKKIEGYLREIR